MAKVKPRILIVDDEADMRLSMCAVLGSQFKVSEAPDGPQALTFLKNNEVHLVIADIRMPLMDGLTLLEKIKEAYPLLPVIVQTAVNDIATSVKAIKLGAYDFLVKPCEPEQLISVCYRALENQFLLQENATLKAELARFDVGKMIGKSKAMQELFRKIKKIANTDVATLIVGETGTGKELVARALHLESERKQKPFIAVNCGAIPAELLESELFGHERGSFTSADTRKLGKFELAQGGTIFLDEIGTMPKVMQTKLLRVLQELEIERIGGTTPIKLDVRIVAATNENIAECVKQGVFREDLYHRLNVVTLQVPALRERDNDCVILAKHFLEKYNAKYHGSFQGFSPAAVTQFRAYAWPGNIRELEHVIQRIVTLEEGPLIEPKHLPLDMLSAATEKELSVTGALETMVNAYEKKLILQTIQEHGGRMQDLAQILQINRSTLRSKMRNYGIKL